MIIGIGTDTIEIHRIQKTLDQFGERFTHRVFSAEERKKAERRPAQGRNTRAATYAKRYAAKEACAKALGTGLGGGVAWREICVVNKPGGQPDLILQGNAQKRLQELVPAPMVPQIHITLTDNDTVAQAIVIISAVPPGKNVFKDR